ncbi:MAG TPA: hypothetical protein VHG89_00615 [Verrucomicrobiae bacterium]|nr:hypothetical protein [Verrucomicrobiae bacterium]
MSRPQKIIPPIKGNFNDILKSIASGKGVERNKPKQIIYAQGKISDVVNLKQKSEQK